MFYDRHWGGHLTDWVLGVTLYVGKLDSNKKRYTKKKKETELRTVKIQKLLRISNSELNSVEVVKD